MNPLSEMPHLFGNGKFKFQVYPFDSSEVFLLVSADPIAGQVKTTYPEEEGGYDWFDIEDCQLIARPIEDMTDEEIRDMCNYKWDSEQCERMRNHLIQLANDGTLPIDSAIEISNRGVYPLSQEDFGDTVIDTRTLKTNA